MSFIWIKWAFKIFSTIQTLGASVEFQFKVHLRNISQNGINCMALIEVIPMVKHALAYGVLLGLPTYICLYLQACSTAKLLKSTHNPNKSILFMFFALVRAGWVCFLGAQQGNCSHLPLPPTASQVSRWCYTAGNLSGYRVIGKSLQCLCLQGRGSAACKGSQVRGSHVVILCDCAWSYSLGMGMGLSALVCALYSNHTLSLHISEFAIASDLRKKVIAELWMMCLRWMKEISLCFPHSGFAIHSWSN